MRRRRAGYVVVAVSAAALMLAFVSGCSSSHYPPTLRSHATATGTEASFAGVDVTVPTRWRLLDHNPAICGSVVGQRAYFYVGSDGPKPGCASSRPTGPFLSVECHPFGSAPTGPTTRVGPFRAVVQRGPDEVTIYLVGRDTQLVLYGSPQLIEQVQSSITTASGNC